MKNPNNIQSSAHSNLGHQFPKTQSEKQNLLEHTTHRRDVAERVHYPLHVNGSPVSFDLRIVEFQPITRCTAGAGYPSETDLNNPKYEAKTYVAKPPVSRSNLPDAR